ncbi:MAG: class I SAM-dependent methyltransferase [Caulobacteraceae bacterium]
MRPDRDVVAAIRAAVDGADRRVLQLGVTPELAGVGKQLIALDRSEAMLDCLWPGDTAARCALRGDWLSCPFSPGSFSAAIGDGSFNCLRHPDDYGKLFGQLASALSSEGRIVIRAFLTPDRAETVGAIRAEALDGRIGSFHAFKWKLAMAMVAEASQPNLPVQSLHDLVVGEFPDRLALAEAAGWNREHIDTIDVYNGSPEIYSFPTLAQLRASAPDSFAAPRLVAAGGYELAERCPVVVIDRL